MNWKDGGVGSWQVEVEKAGYYFLEIEYSADDKVDFSEWILSFEDEELMVQALDTGERSDSARQPKGRSLYRYRTNEVGLVNLKAGKQVIKISPKGKVMAGGINLKAIHLTPFVE